MSFPFAYQCFKWDSKIYFISTWISTKRHLTKKKTKKLEKALRMVCLKRKKRAQKLAYLTCSYNLRNQDNRRQPDYLKDYHLGTLPLETPIRNTNLPPAHSNVCTLFRDCVTDFVWFFRRIRSALWPPLCRVRSWERLRRLSEWWRRKTPTQPPTMKRTSTKSTSSCRQPSGSRQISKKIIQPWVEVKILPFWWENWGIPFSLKDKSWF